MDRLNQWLTLVANLAVVAGIVFLAVETDQNTQMMRATAVQASTDVARQQILYIAELAENKSDRDFWINRSGVIGMQGLYRQWKMGVLPDEEWGMWQRIICWNSQGQHWKERWPDNSTILIPDFVAYVDHHCAPESR